MAIVIRSKNPPKRIKRVPVDSIEGRLTRQLARVLKTAQRAVTKEEILRAMDDLDPAAMNRIYDQGNVYALDGYMQRALESAVFHPSLDEFSRVVRTPMSRGVARTRSFAVRQPSGIFVPSDLVRKSVDYDDNLFAGAVFDYINPRSIDYAASRAASLVRDISESNRRALREILVDSYSRGLPQEEIAAIVRQVVGLPTRWARAVASFRGRTVDQMVNSGFSVPDAYARADVLGDRYRSRLLQKRAEMIARTEIMTAQNMGRLFAWDAGVDSGVIDPAAEKMWQVSPPGVSGGEGPCEHCLEVNGFRVGIFDTFTVRGQSLLTPPAHPHCRCVVQLVPPSRGLTGLPSQDMDQWLVDLDAFYVEMEAAA